MQRPEPVPEFIIVMGVSGCGKSTVAEGLSTKLGWPFRDGDDFHPAANVAKMAGGHPLNDEDRAPWLAAIADWIDQHRHIGQSVIVTCSALKKSYRNALLNHHTDVRFVYLKGTQALLTSRINARKGHFMPSALLLSQLATLEEPGADEPAITVSIDATPEAIEAQILNLLHLKV